MNAMEKFPIDAGLDVPGYYYVAAWDHQGRSQPIDGPYATFAEANAQVTRAANHMAHRYGSQYAEPAVGWRSEDTLPVLAGRLQKDGILVPTKDAMANAWAAPTGWTEITA